jgi:SAM-dependent methyltransferase
MVHERMKLEKAIRRVIPSTARLTYNPIFKIIVDSFDLLPKLMYKEFSKIPPNHMRIRVGVANRFLANQVSYVNLGKDFWMYAFRAGLCRLDSTIVDIGCGCGRYTHHLRDYRFGSERFSGKYIGIDIDEEMLNWCRANFDSERFEFYRSDHGSKAYKAAGNSEAYYVLPLPEEAADFVFSTSLFTHLLEKELFNYARESYRVLKRDCFMAMACFSMDHPPPTLGNRHTFQFKSGNAYVESLAVPEAVVAYEEKFLLQIAREAGFRTSEMLIGGPNDWQHMLLCRK